MSAFDPDDLASWCGGEWTSRPAGPIRRILQDTRVLRPGDFYVALRGARFDGHEFLPQAFAAGASGALAARSSPAAARPAGPLLLTDDPAAALTALARGHREKMPCRRIGVTGSVGKTGVKNLTVAALSPLGATTGTPGNWNNSIGLPLSLLGVEPGHAFGVFEVGMNRPGELRPLCALLKPEAAILTPIGPAHIEFFESERAIAEEKAALLDALPPDGFAVLAADELWFDLLRERTPYRVVTVACAGPADYAVRPDPRGARIRERGGGEFVYPVPMPGRPGLSNTVRAVALARELGAAPEAIARALAAAAREPGRWQKISEAGILWIHDAYNANPLSVQAALTLFAESEPAARKWLVLGGMGELGAYSESAHRELGRRIADGPWAGLILCGARAAGFARGAREAGMEAGRIWETDNAVRAAAELGPRLKPGDAVLLKGSRAERIEAVFENWRRQHDEEAPPIKDHA